MRWAAILPIILCTATAGVCQAPRGGLPQTPPGNLLVHVLSPLGDPLNAQAIVKIQSNTSGYFRTEATRDASQAQFNGIPYGDYVIEASAPGYDPGQERVDVLPGQTIRAFVTMRPEGYAKRNASSPDTNTVLSPKAQKELEQGLAAMNAGDLHKAKADFEKVRKMAPGHPEPHFLLAALAFREGDMAGAEQSARKALSLNPKHAAANALLGRILVRKGELDAAIEALQASVLEDTDNWQTHGLLGQTLLQKAQFEKAASHLQRALVLSAGKAPNLAVSLAFALANSGKKEAALRYLDEFISGNPQHPDVGAARDLRRRYASPAPAGTQITPAKAIEAPVVKAPEPEVESPDWAPNDVDQTKPYVTPNVSCSLPDIMTGAAGRVTQLAENLEGITAHETVEFTELNPKGVAKNILSKQFLFFVSISKVGKRNLAVEEYRDGRAESTSFPSHLVTNGLTALALIFHPFYSGDLNFRCEGLAQWKGESVWLVHFQQRDGVRSRMRSYRLPQGKFPVDLKGRVWIAANTYEILRLETDLMAPVEKAELEREHITVEYQPVTFQKKGIVLWLPESGEMFTKLAGKRYRQRHVFSDFTYFSVETKQKISDPKGAEKDPPQF